MVSALQLLELMLAILLISLVLMQRTYTDNGGAFSSDAGGAAVLVKRGAEKVLHQTTIIVSFLFVASVLVHLFF